MSCRQITLCSLVFSVIKQDYPINERTIQEVYHKLCADSRVGATEDAPTQKDVVAFIDELIGRFKQYPVEQVALIKRAEKAKEEDVPDKRTWLALKHLENTLKFTYDLDLPK